VLASVWDNSGSYDQVGFSNDYGVWGLTTSYTTGPCSSPTYWYSPDWLTLATGTTYDFYAGVSGGDTWFEVYQAGTEIFWEYASTGATALSIANSYCGYYNYTDYIEVWYTHVSGGYPAFMFVFMFNEYYNGASWMPTPWAALFIGPTPSIVHVMINGQSNSVGPLTYTEYGVGTYLAGLTASAAYTVLFVQPDFNAPRHTAGAVKCAGLCGPAALSDYSSGGYFLSKLAHPQYESVDTSSLVVSQSTGTCGESLVVMPTVLMAGPNVNMATRYRELVQDSPLYWDNSLGAFVVRSTGATYTVLPLLTATQDYFAFQSFSDQYGHYVLIIYGVGWAGTIAAGVYFLNYIYPNMGSFTAGWYILRWNDAASGVSANGYPDPGDTYTMIAFG
jgi:hypothetical protein